MSAEIISLADVRARRQQASQAETANASAYPVPPGAVIDTDSSTRFRFWTGASGRRYVHTVYSMFDCPPLDCANYILVRKGAKGARQVLSIGCLTNPEPSLNLAEIRQRGASLGAEEVHVHLLATSPFEAQAVEVDLKTAQFVALSG